ncbi:Telomere maintenance protein [Mycena indigotica]|uniref:Telomere maintenance protein n=1 Tax=Mycena indigotica TaxID=2126181 RepID=A0A8H6TGN0_9AGAR|nr:Telomere maintenance protein [Mycena indigotica]KAF7316402.1 Telomere maintenance protein [Mycena indigotica]
MAETTTTASLTPTDFDIEKVIQQATQAAQADGRPIPLRDTRTQLFVANLPYRVRWQDLKDLFRRAGTVLRADVSLGPDNRSRGYGTVLLATAEDAGRAVDMFSGYSWQGRILEVRADRVRDFDQPFPEIEEEYAPMGRNLFVGNLPFHVQWQDLKDLFRQAGTIVRADVALGPEGRSRGFGTVVFATEKDARRAVTMFSGYEFNGRTLKVHYDKFSPSPQPFDIGLPPSAAFDLGLGADYTAEIFPTPHPFIQPRPFEHSIAQFQSLQLDPQLSEPPATVSSRTSPPSTSSTAPSTPSTSVKRSPTSPHPHHPGPIALPPPPAIPSDQAAGPAAFNPPPYGLTPAGLPPITPSMPPFSFHPMPMPSPGTIPQPAAASYFAVGPTTPTHGVYSAPHFLNVTPLATPTSPHFPAYIMNPGVLPSPGLNGIVMGPPSVGVLSPGAFWGRAGENGGVFGAPGPVGQPVNGQVGSVHPAFAHHFGGSPGVFGMHSMGPPEEPKGYFDLAPTPVSSAISRGIEKEILKTPDGKKDSDSVVDVVVKEEPSPDSSALGDAETQSMADAEEEVELLTPPSEGYKGRRYSSYDQPPPSPIREGRRAPPPPIQLPSKTGSR